MQIRIATQTLQKIDHMVQEDQGSLYRKFLGQVIGHIGDAYREGNDGHRTHLGASLIGQECPRAIWYNFHWATKSNFPGRIIRLFNRGHLEEARFIAILLMIGCQVYQQDENGNQFRISHCNGHFGGSGDGVVIGLPEFQPGLPVLTEFKTHGEKSFIELAGKSWRKFIDNYGTPKAIQFDGKGVREAKFEHYVQMQVYMRKMQLTAALYVAVNKNTDDLYAEIIVLDTAVGDQFLDRAAKIIEMNKPPARINNSPGFYKCRLCDHRPVCHLGAAPDINCRTCQFSIAHPDGTWRCTNPQSGIDVIPKEVQLTGCKHYKVRKDF